MLVADRVAVDERLVERESVDVELALAVFVAVAVLVADRVTVDERLVERESVDVELVLAVFDAVTDLDGLRVADVVFEDAALAVFVRDAVAVVLSVSARSCTPYRKSDMCHDVYPVRRYFAQLLACKSVLAVVLELHAPGRDNSRPVKRFSKPGRDVRGKSGAEGEGPAGFGSLTAPQMTPLGCLKGEGTV